MIFVTSWGRHWFPLQFFAPIKLFGGSLGIGGFGRFSKRWEYRTVTIDRWIEAPSLSFYLISSEGKLQTHLPLVFLYSTCLLLDYCSHRDLHTSRCCWLLRPLFQELGRLEKGTEGNLTANERKWEGSLHVNDFSLTLSFEILSRRQGSMLWEVLRDANTTTTRDVSYEFR